MVWMAHVLAFFEKMTQVSFQQFKEIRHIEMDRNL